MLLLYLALSPRVSFCLGDCLNASGFGALYEALYIADLFHGEASLKSFSGDG
jgi:hypothetical protein